MVWSRWHERDAPAKRTLCRLLMPLSLLAATILWLVLTNRFRSFNNGAPPVENLTFERTILDASGFHLPAGSQPMKIAQVQVDAAYWPFQQT